MTNKKFDNEIATAVRSDGEQCDELTVERLFASLDADGQKWLNTATDDEVWSWAVNVLINTQPPINLCNAGCARYSAGEK